VAPRAQGRVQVVVVLADVGLVVRKQVAVDATADQIRPLPGDSARGEVHLGGDARHVDVPAADPGAALLPTIVRHG